MEKLKTLWYNQLVKRFGSSKVLIHYGGGSVKRNGVFDSVVKSLEDAQIPYIELGAKEAKAIYRLAL